GDDGGVPLRRPTLRTADAGRAQTPRSRIEYFHLSIESESKLSGFDAFSSREPVSISLENATGIRGTFSRRCHRTPCKSQQHPRRSDAEHRSIQSCLFV